MSLSGGNRASVETQSTSSEGRANSSSSEQALHEAPFGSRTSQAGDNVQAEFTLPTRIAKSIPESGTSESLSTNDSPGAEPSGSGSPERPNRYHGAERTWKHWTSPERHLAASIDQQRADDLSIHLYNAHALKRRLWSQEKIKAAKPWHRKERWIDDHEGNEWYPHRGWTAWPLDPEEVPRHWERFGEPLDDGEEQWTVRMARKEKPSNELEEILVGLALKIAKERWKKQEQIAEAQKDPKRGKDGNNIVSQPDRDQHSTQTAASLPEDVLSNGELPAGPGSASSTGSVTTGSTEGQASSEASEGSARSEDESLTPDILADDDRAHHLLRPSVRSVLANLDALLLALQRSRESHTRAASEESDDQEVEETRGRAREQPRPESAAHRRASVASSLESDRSGSNPPQKRRQGRPSMYPEPMEGESYYKMRKRVQRALSTASQSEGGVIPTLPLASKGKAKTLRKGQRRRSSSSGSRSGSDSAKSFSYGLRDWSEVLGIAALVGWKPSIIERAANRCSALFGETMKLHKYGHEEALQATQSETTYRPALVESVEEAVGSARSDSSGLAIGPSLPADLESLTCAYVGCGHNSKPFENRAGLMLHVESVHLHGAGAGSGHSRGETHRRSIGQSSPVEEDGNDPDRGAERPRKRSRVAI